MRHLTTIQDQLKYMIENYKFYNKEYSKYQLLCHKFELEGDVKRDFEERMKKIKASINKDDYSAKLNTLQENIYKLCKKLDKNSIKDAVPAEFNILVSENTRGTGNFYTFYLDNKQIFSRFELYPQHAYEI